MRNKWIRTSFACSALALEAMGAPAKIQNAGQHRPNVLIIFTDDLDFDELGGFDPLEYPTFTGAKEKGFSKSTLNWGIYPKRPSTPNIDRLMHEGMTFTQFRVTSTVCTPSRYCLLTGQYASRSETLGNKYPPAETADVEFNTDILPGQWHLGRALHDAGYVSAIVGKWHLTAVKNCPGIIDPPIRDDHGQENDSEAVRKMKTAAQDAVLYLTEKEGFDFAASIYMANGNQLGLPKEMVKCEANMEWMTGGALKFLNQYAASAEENKKPFFLYFAPGVPHGIFGTRILQGDPRATPEGYVDWHLSSQPPRAGISARLKAQGLDASAAMPMWLDDGVGSLLNRLDELGLAENTIVIFSSDQQSRGKWTCYDGARVPAMIRWPGKIKAGSVCDRSLSSIDVVPTLLEICGVTPPTNAVVDGRSFLPVLSGGTIEERPVLIEMGYGRAVVFKGWKYIARRQPGDFSAKGGLSKVRMESGAVSKDCEEWPSYGATDELFDLTKDPYEQDNLAGNPEDASKLAEMRSVMKQVLAPLPHPFSEFKPVAH